MRQPYNLSVNNTLVYMAFEVFKISIGLHVFYLQAYVFYL